MNKKKFMKIFFPILGAVVLITGIYWSVIEFVLKDYQNIGYIRFRYTVDQDGNSEGTPAYITGIPKESNYPAVFEVPSKLLGHPVVGIDSQAFTNLSRLEKIILPSTVEQIGDEAFSQCPLLTDVVVNGELKSVGNDIFAGSGWLNAHSDEEYINFGNFLYKYNGNRTTEFILKSEKDKQSGEDESKYVYIPSGITNLASGAFSNQPYLAKVEIPDEYTVLEKDMFKNCPKLVSVDINNVTTIKSDVFNGCTNLNSIDIEKITSIGNGAFKGTALEVVTLNENVTAIGQSVFENCINLTSIDIPNSVTIIGNDAFAGDANLKNISLTDSIVEIGNRAFKETGIEEFVFPKYVDTINSELFANAKSLTKVVLPNVEDDNTGILNISSKAFMNTEKLTNIEFPKNANGVETIRTIEANAFEGSGLKSITIPKELSSLEDAIFRNCVNLEEVKFYEDGWLNTINAECFRGTKALTSITFPNTVTVFFSKVLMDSGVSEVKLSTNEYFTTINESFFENCVNLTHLDIPENITTIGPNVFKGCTNLESISLSNNIRRIDSSAFENDSALTSVVIPNNADSIDKMAFKDCSLLESITISNNVYIIGEDAFLNAEALENVYYYGTIEEWNRIVFVNEYSNPMHYANHFYITDGNGGWTEVTDQLS